MPENATDSPLLEVTDLVVDYHGRHGSVRAVDGIDLRIEPGETLGLVGESGSGKTSIGRAILGLIPVTSGRIRFDEVELSRYSSRQRRRHAGGMRVIFQDPYGSLNPALRISASLLEGVDGPRRRAEDRMIELLDQVGLSVGLAQRYPSRLSGGQRQRIAVARALMSEPQLIICDEAVSSLDVSVQAQVLNLLRELQRELSLSYLFIGHDLDVVRYMSDRIAVLYRGRIVEEGSADQIAREPGHDYTRALVAAIPRLQPSVDAERVHPPIAGRGTEAEGDEPFHS